MMSPIPRIRPARLIRHERLELIQLLPTPANLTPLRHPRIERAAPPRVAIELRQHDSGDAERFVKMGGNADGLRPVAASATSRTWGQEFFSSLIPISAASISRRPAVSKI
jgi:hypothetical protein